MIIGRKINLECGYGAKNAGYMDAINVRGKKIVTFLLSLIGIMAKEPIR